MTRTMRKAAALAAVVLVGAATGANAFDTLKQALSRIGDSGSETRILFDFLAPDVVRGWPVQDNPGTPLYELNMAAVGSSFAPLMTGIDFSALSGILTFGDPPNDAIYLAGPIDTALVSAAFTGRGFALSSEGSSVIFAKGDDYKLNIMDRDRNDPFGHSLGVAQRVAVGAGGVLETRSWATLRKHLALADGAPAAGGTSVLFADMVAAAAAARPGTEAFAAMGATRGAFAAPPAGSPLFDYALFIVSTGSAPGTEAAQIVLAYPDRATAEADMTRLQAAIKEMEGTSPRTAPALATNLAESGPTIIGVLTATYPDAPGHPASKILTAWRNATYKRDFTALVPPG